MNDYKVIKDALEAHYTRHPQFFVSPLGHECCPPLDEALTALDRLWNLSCSVRPGEKEVLCPRTSGTSFAIW